MELLDVQAYLVNVDDSGQLTVRMRSTDPPFAVLERLSLAAEPFRITGYTNEFIVTSCQWWADNVGETTFQFNLWPRTKYT